MLFIIVPQNQCSNLNTYTCQISQPTAASAMPRAFSILAANYPSNVNTHLGISRKVCIAEATDSVLLLINSHNFVKRLIVLLCISFQTEFPFNYFLLLKIDTSKIKFDSVRNKIHNPNNFYFVKIHLINLMQKISFPLIQSENVGKFSAWGQYKNHWH